MSERRDVVLNAPIGRAIWSLAWPMLIANELETCVVGAELFWLGRLIGESGLVVESLYRPFGLMIAWFFASTTVGSSALVSRSVGASDGRGLQITTASMTLTMALCAAVVAVVVPFSPQIAGLLAGDASVQSSMLPYLLAMIVAAVPAGAVLSVLLEVTNATGETRFTIARIVIDLAFITITAPLLMEAGLGIAGPAISIAIVRWGLFGAVTWQILLACFSAYQTTVRAGIVMVFGEAFGVALAFAWPGSPLDSVCAAFVGSNLLKAGALCWLYFRAGPTASR